MNIAVGLVLLLTATNALAFNWNWPIAWPTWPWDQPSKSTPVPVRSAPTTTPAAIEQNSWKELRLHFSPLGKVGGFYKLEQSSTAAKAEGYTTPPEETTTDLEVLCPNNDPSICVLFDKQGNVAGMDISIKKSDVVNTTYPFDQHPSFVPKTRFGFSVLVTRLFFVLDGVLTNEGSKKAGAGKGVQLQNGTDPNSLFEVPRLEADIGKTAYTKENCVPGMGVHYYYNISESMQCEDFMPIFALYRSGDLLGFGFQTFGRVKPVDKVWFEAIPSVAVRPTIPNSPQCLVDGADTYGIVSLHVYFVEEPWAIKCTSAQTSE